jgi:hypothetical protein
MRSPVTFDNASLNRTSFLDKSMPVLSKKFSWKFGISGNFRGIYIYIYSLTDRYKFQLLSFLYKYYYYYYNNNNKLIIMLVIE